MDSKNLHRGTQLFELGRYNDAIKYFNDALAENPDDFNAKHFLAFSHFNLGNYDLSEELADSLLKELPNDPILFFLKAKIAFQKEDFDKALQSVEMSISIDPTDADFFALKGAIFLSLKKYEESLKNVNIGLRLNPKNNYCLNLRAQALTKLNRIDKAAETVKDILSDNPEDVFSHSNVGWVELETGNNKKALVHFKEALQLDPNFEHARLGMSTALKSKNIIYRWYLKYAFWIEKQSSKNQWFFIIGIYLAYRFSMKILDTAGMSYLVTPLIIVYLLFALGAWIMEPLSNTILSFDAYGKYLLDKQEKRSGLVLGGLLLLGIIALALFYTLDNMYFLVLGIAFFCSLLPIPRAFLITNKKGRNFGLCYGLLILFVGIFGALFTKDYFLLGAIVILMMVAFTWIGNLFN